MTEWGRILTIGGTAALFCTYLATVALLFSTASLLLILGLLVAYIVPPAGRETVIPLGIALGLPWWLIAGTIWLFDIISGVIVVLNFDLLCTVPLVGPWMMRFTTAGRGFLEERPWIGRFYIIGLIAFIMFPLEGSGSVSGSILGRILGMGASTILACIILGSGAGCLVIAVAFDAVYLFLREDVLLTVSVAMAIGIAAYLAYLIRRKTGNQRSA